MTIIADIVNKIRTTLVNELGVFQSINRPAVVVIPSEYDSKINGIAAFIERSPDTAPVGLMGGVYYPDVYRITLVNYDEKENEKMSAAMRKLSLVFDIVGQQYIPPERDNDLYEQAFIDIFYPSYDLRS